MFHAFHDGKIGSLLEWYPTGEGLLVPFSPIMLNKALKMYNYTTIHHCVHHCFCECTLPTFLCWCFYDSTTEWNECMNEHIYKLSKKTTKKKPFFQDILYFKDNFESFTYYRSLLESV